MLRIYLTSLLWALTQYLQGQSCTVKIWIDQTNFSQFNNQCEGGDVHISVYPYSSSKNYEWTFGNRYMGNTIGFGLHDGGGYVFNTVRENSGWIYLTVTDNMGCSFTDSAFLHVRPVPQPIITGASFACYGTTTAVKAIDIKSYNAPYTYLWENGATTQKIMVPHNGGYYPAPSVQMINKYGCAALNGNTLFIGTHYTSTPKINNLTDTIICEGNKAVLEIDHPHQGEKYRWLHNNILIPMATQEILQTSHAGTYTAKVIDHHGCKALSPPVNILIDKPWVMISSSANTLCGVDSVILQAVDSGNHAYQWRANNLDIPGATQSNYAALHNGRYKVIVTNQAGCSHASNAIMLTGDNCREAAGLSFEITQPTHTLLVSSENLLCHTNSSASGELICYNSLGSTIEHRRIMHGINDIDLSNIPTGIYFVKIMIANTQYSYKLIKQQNALSMCEQNR